MISSNIAVIALVFLFGLVLGGVAIWLLGRRHTAVRTAPEAKPTTPLSFRLNYIALPGALALTTVIAIAILSPSIPAELAYRFSSSGAPQGFMGREFFLSIMIGAQLIAVGLAAIIAFFIIRTARRILQSSPAPVAPGRIIWLMVNILVLPQLLVAFVALDAAYYARTSSHIMTPWLFSLLAVGIGTLVIIVLFALSFNETRKA